MTRLAGDLDLEPATVGRWARGVCQPQVRKAIAIVEVARAAGSDLTLEDIYKTRGKQTKPWITPAQFSTLIDLIPESVVVRVRARARDDYKLELPKAVAIIEVARSAGVDLTLEEIYARHFARIRARIRSGEPPL